MWHRSCFPESVHRSSLEDKQKETDAKTQQYQKNKHHRLLRYEVRI